MARTPESLASAFAALTPSPATLDDAATALNAQTTLVPVAVPVQSVAIYLASQGKLSSFTEWAQSPPAGASNVAVVAARELAFILNNSNLISNFDMTNATTANSVETWLSALVSPGSGVVGPISSADQSALLKMGSQAVPTWNPPVQITELQQIQRAKLITSSIPPYAGYSAP